MRTFRWRCDGPMPAFIAAMLIWPAVTAGQETRAGAHEQAQAAKATIVTAPTANVVERGIRTLKSLGVLASVPKGFYPEVTTIYPDGWLAFGGGYRHPLGDAGRLDVSSAWSLQNFKRVGARLVAPTTLADTLSLEIEGQWMDAPSVAFYGIGNDTRPEDETTFAYRPTTMGVTLSSAPWPSVTVGGGVGLLSIDTVSASDDSPDLADLLTSPPGLEQGPRYLRSRGFAQVDWRQAPGYTGTGGLYRIEVLDYAERSGSHLSFRSAEAEVVQFVPILRANWVIALRGLATVTDDGTADDVPFYLMPWIGGSTSVRGYPSFRFRGNHRVLMNAEYRWTATRYLDMAVFYDTGKVAMRLEDLNLQGLKSGYGIGARFHGITRTVMRIEVARSDQGDWRLVWTTGAAF